MYAALFMAAFHQLSGATVEDVSAIYKQNSGLVSTLRVRWELERKPTTSQLAFHQSTADRFQKELDRGNVPADVRSRVEGEIREHRRLADLGPVAKATEIVTVQQDFWTDHTHFQVRSPINRKYGVPFQYGPAVSVAYPNVEASRDELASTFRNIYVLSYTPDAREKFRTWDAFELNTGLHSATIHNTNKHPECYFPPLSSPKPEWGGKPNPIDEFFDVYCATGTARILGTVSIHGTDTTLIQAELPADKSGMIRTARVFVDVEHGALPLRMEFFNGSLAEFSHLRGICVDHKELRASVVVSDIHLKAFKHGQSTFWYPQSGVIQRLSRANSPAEAVSKLQPDISIHEVTSWRVLELELDREMSAQNFAFEFPEKTLFVNGTTGELMVTGDADGVAKRYVQGSITNIPKRSIWKYWLGGIAALSGLLVAWRLRQTRVSK